MERVVRIAALLNHAKKQGVPAQQLLDVAGWADAADGISALNRDLRHLKGLGWQIENIAGEGVAAVYKMTNVDNRLRLRLTPEQQTALRRAVLLVDPSDLADRLGLSEDARPAEVGAAVAAGAGPDESLSTVIRALRQGARLRYRYNGSDRLVHPQSVRTQQTHWYLHGQEDGQHRVKAFVVSRMSEVRADGPGSAMRFLTAPHPGLHPMTWQIDPPIDVTLRAPAEYAPDVQRWLSTPESQTEEGGVAELFYRVTNRAALRARLYQLGTRVTVVEPDELRREILDELAEMAGE